jgi:hypothetical protein
MKFNILILLNFLGPEVQKPNRFRSLLNFSYNNPLFILTKFLFKSSNQITVLSIINNAASIECKKNVFNFIGFWPHLHHCPVEISNQNKEIIIGRHRHNKVNYKFKY